MRLYAVSGKGEIVTPPPPDASAAGAHNKGAQKVRLYAVREK